MAVPLQIDLNADVGERPGLLEDGTEAALIGLISSANIACGGHAGTPDSMRRIVQLCAAHHVAIGAHPGYPDKEGFGRIDVTLPPHLIQASVFEQMNTLITVADSCGQRVLHVKPHGALYNKASGDAVVAGAIAQAVTKLRYPLAMVGLAGSLMLEVWGGYGLRVVGEAFADRTYEPDGSLRLRSHADALITDPVRAAQQVQSIVQGGFVRAVDGSRVPVTAQTICVHGDTSGALEIVREIRRVLTELGCSILPVGPQTLPR